MKQFTRPVSQDRPEIDFATLDLLPYGIIVVDETGTILYYNAREEQIAERRREDVIGKNFFTEVAPCTQVREFHGRFKETVLRAGSVADFHFRFPFPGRPREVEISLTSFEKDGALLCLISVSDVTEKQNLREHLMSVERLREVGEVAAGVAHNFNNLLTVIRGNSELIMMRLPAGDPIRAKAENILKAAVDGTEMVKRIRDTTRTQPESVPGMATVDLNEVVRDSVSFTEDYARQARDERGAGVTFDLDLASNPLRLRANASELREVFVNLLRNAVDAVTGEGRVAVRTSGGGRRAAVEVSDTGAGMSREVLEKIFRPLFTTKGERGTGLGLATSYAAVKRHGGDVEVESEEGRGTTFRVTLPLAGG